MGYEVVGEAARDQEVAECQFVAGLGQDVPGPAVKPPHLDQHPQVGRIGGRTRLGEQAGQATSPGVLEPAALAADRQAHLGGLAGYPQLTEEAGQQRVGSLVVHDEPGVDGHGAAAGREHVVGVGMAPQARLGLVQTHVVPALQEIGSRQTRHPGADDGDPFPARHRVIRNTSQQPSSSVVGPSGDVSLVLKRVEWWPSRKK